MIHQAGAEGNVVGWGTLAVPAAGGDVLALEVAVPRCAHPVYPLTEVGVEGGVGVDRLARSQIVVLHHDGDGHVGAVVDVVRGRGVVAEVVGVVAGHNSGRACSLAWAFDRRSCGQRVVIAARRLGQQGVEARLDDRFQVPSAGGGQ